MDAFIGYNQIHMKKENQEKIAFVTSQGLYCYKVVIWIEKRRCHLPETSKPSVQQANRQEYGGLCGQHVCEN